MVVTVETQNVSNYTVNVLKKVISVETVTASDVKIKSGMSIGKKSSKTFKRKILQLFKFNLKKQFKMKKFIRRDVIAKKATV